MPLPSLPPAFHLVGLDHEVAAFPRAVQAAPRGIDHSTVYWTERSDRLELAVVLEPESPAPRTLEAVYVLTAAAGEALVRFLPPDVPVAYAWPGDILLDGARAGRIRATLAPVADSDMIPPWLVLGLTLDLAPLPHDPGRLPDRTSLHDQGATEISAADVMQEVIRNHLRWTNHWQELGLEPVRAAWNLRCFRRGRLGGLTIAEERIEGIVAGLNESGDLVVGDRRLPLAIALDSLA